ncbi:Protein of unknown function [Actinobaculum suis]|uniref:DUF3073 domain-containing protein n=1 Tax=Actinobaculum suis TaxID=1657 RepID=A0A0K9ETS3_9ACTO|nr:DUF3073 domain-containing protein [Actinobaculum suis]KMY23251.1 hypothetical protein ACU19_05660 [Actinobaculum suis]MDY5152629.1 DUF3073 domain-containing protein [Actinobaculum suis]SDE11801.1 Protein of unknown function [Actinobaculum suis]VDG75436.1 Protein of uncharacterised function (DUF3073) [Actinobaculum suis]
MGRGRQKAKQRKVARNLKYYTPDTDYAALERELRQQSGASNTEQTQEDSDPYAAYYDDYAEYDPWADKYEDAEDDSKDQKSR